jgi:hypothetical protein
LLRTLEARLSRFIRFWETDAYVTCDMPDNTTAASVALAVNASGAANATTVVLMTPEEMDEATKREVGLVPGPRLNQHEDSASVTDDVPQEFAVGQ